MCTIRRSPPLSVPLIGPLGPGDERTGHPVGNRASVSHRLVPAGSGSRYVRGRSGLGVGDRSDVYHPTVAAAFSPPHRPSRAGGRADWTSRWEPGQCESPAGSRRLWLPLRTGAERPGSWGPVICVPSVGRRRFQSPS